MNYEIHLSSNKKALKDELKKILSQDKLEALGSLIDLGHKEMVLDLSLDGHLIGGLLAVKDQENLEISQFAIRAKDRGQGLGRQILLFIEDWARREGVRTISFSILSYQNRSFFEKAGYINYSTLKDVPRQGIDRHLFIKYLD